MSKMILRPYRWKGKPLSSIQPYLNFPRICVFSFGTHLLKVILGPPFTETLPCSRSHTALSEESTKKNPLKNKKGRGHSTHSSPTFWQSVYPLPPLQTNLTFTNYSTHSHPILQTNLTFTNYCSSPLHHCNYSTFSGPPRTTTLAKEHFTQPKSSTFPSHHSPPQLI